MISMTKIRSGAQQRTKGFTLTEIAIVLGIVGLILGAVWAAAKNVYTSQASSSFVQQMSVYAAQLRAACPNQCAGALPPTTNTQPTVAGGTAANGVRGLATGGQFRLSYTMPGNINQAARNLMSGLRASASVLQGTLYAGTEQQAAPTFNTNANCVDVSGTLTVQCGTAPTGYALTPTPALTAACTAAGALTAPCTLSLTSDAQAGQAYTLQFSQTF